LQNNDKSDRDEINLVHKINNDTKRTIIIIGSCKRELEEADNDKINDEIDDNQTANNESIVNLLGKINNIVG
jgi:hypothetical protein